MMKFLEGFHHYIASRIVGKTEQQAGGGGLVMTPIGRGPRGCSTVEYAGV